ncbi:hypothetical protein [Alteribacter natronophilus]|uniref:hypothetical protein n=1 Tax=Alteribacter natronophilus TaxID=2583810 RepID=UPI00110DDBDD|nr:hypothetical protein [Alteribacter natronophilus]TMW70671.1 hypothetical protein FGB90_15935 [Alteribacter natronophilus]
MKKMIIPAAVLILSGCGAQGTVQQEYNDFWAFHDEYDPYEEFRLLVDQMFVDVEDEETIESTYYAIMDAFEEAYENNSSFNFESEEMETINHYYIRSLEKFQESVMIFENDLDLVAADAPPEELTDEFSDLTGEAAAYQAQKISAEIEYGLLDDEDVTEGMQNLIDQFMPE